MALTEHDHMIEQLMSAVPDPVLRNTILPGTAVSNLIKSRQHFRAGFESIIAHVVMVSGPAITTSDYGLPPWKNVCRPVYPLDPDTEPNLPVATERTPRAEGA